MNQPRSFLPVRLRWRSRPPRAAAAVALALVACAATEHGAPNVPFPTLGGRQLWRDVAWDAGWRVQRHVWTGHARLLDERDVRRAWGTAGACRAALVERRTAGELAPPRRDLAVLVHGLGRSHGSWGDLAGELRADGFDVLVARYPSTRAGLDAHAEGLAALLASVPGERRVSFVTHSLGGLVVRAVLADDDAAWRDRHEPWRVAMIAPPSRGSALAREVSRLAPMRWLLGPVLVELAGDRAAALAVPEVPFALVLPSRGTREGWNPLVPGDDDGVVGVEEARLPGAARVVEVRALHALAPRDEEVHAAVRAFLAR